MKPWTEARNNNGYINLTPNLHTNSHFKIWAEKWTFRHELKNLCRRWILSAFGEIVILRVCVYEGFIPGVKQIAGLFRGLCTINCGAAIKSKRK